MKNQLVTSCAVVTAHVTRVTSSSRPFKATRGSILALLPLLASLVSATAQDFWARSVDVTAPGGSYQSLWSDLREGDKFEIQFNYAWGNVWNTMAYDMYYDGQLAGGGLRSVSGAGYWYLSSSWGWTLTASQGLHTVVGVLDPDDDVLEISEVNNMIIRTVLVAAATAPSCFSIALTGNTAMVSFTNLPIGQSRILRSTTDLLSTNAWLQATNFTPYTRCFSNSVPITNSLLFLKLE